MSRLHQFANPMRFARLSKTLLPWMGALTVLLIGAGLYWALVVSPVDYQQSDSVRIMYIHVPAAWMALFIYVTMAGASAVGLIWRHPLADIAAKSCAPIGACFTFVALATGALWGQPMWGTWWVWDGRLTSVLVLFFLYIGYMALWSAYDEPGKASRAAAILALVGVVNVPIIHFSVEWWNTLHQPASVFKVGGPSIDPSMLWPLLVMALGFTAYFVVVLLWRMRAEILARRIHILMMQQAAS
jgi:heme exporter protein C